MLSVVLYRKLLLKNIVRSKFVCRPVSIIENSKNLGLRFLKLSTQVTSNSSDGLVSNLQSRKSSRKIIGLWSLTCSGMVFIAVLLGGVTRLTESGLSMVTWQFLGEKIPTDENLWINEFENYKKFPEFQIVKRNMTLEEFKHIWWMEYAHRMWGRLIGLVFIIPASFFWFKKMIDPGMKKRVLVLGSLIGFQGLLGWYMVKSGLENKFHGPSDIPRVSQYRLAAHLSGAIIIYSGFFYTALDCLFPFRENSINLHISKSTIANMYCLRRFRSVVYASKIIILSTAISGAFVAGLDAGLIYNTFPKMAGKWIPDDYLYMTPILKNFTENPATVQFNHRILAALSLCSATIIGLISRRYKLTGPAYAAALAVSFTAYYQAILGILTLLNHVPTYLAALHQSGSLILISSILWLCNEIKHIKKISR